MKPSHSTFHNSVIVNSGLFYLWMALLPVYDVLASLSYANLPNVDILNNINKSYLLILPITNLIRNAFKYGGSGGGCFCQAYRARYKFSKILFLLEIWNFLLIDNKYCQLFSVKCQAYLVHSEKQVCQIPSLNSQCLSVVLPSKSDIPWKKIWLVRLTTQTNHQCFSCRQPSYFSTEEMLPISSHSILKRCVLKWGLEPVPLIS